MKRIIPLFMMFFGSNWPMTVVGQATIEISGTVKSTQGAVQGAEVYFLDTQEDFLSNCMTGPAGRFKSEGKMLVGKTIKIKITKQGFKTLEKVVKISKTGNVGELLLTKSSLAISGFVKDSITEQALQGVEVFFYENSKLIQSRSTNSMGYFNIDADYVHGQKITVRVQKHEYYPKEQTLTITSEGMNILQDILLPELGARGLRAFINLKDKKGGKPLTGANIRYFDKKRSTYIDTLMKSKSQLELKLFQRPGTTLDLEISMPRYRTIYVNKTLSEEPLNNVFAFKMERESRPAVGQILLVSGVAGVLVSGGMYFSSTSLYRKYKDFKNESRETDYDKAQRRRNISVVAGGVGIGAITGYIIYKTTQKKKLKAQEGSKKLSFILSSPFDEPFVDARTTAVGVAYRF